MVGISGAPLAPLRWGAQLSPQRRLEGLVGAGTGSLCPTQRGKPYKEGFLLFLPAPRLPTGHPGGGPHGRSALRRDGECPGCLASPGLAVCLSLLALVNISLRQGQEWRGLLWAPHWGLSGVRERVLGQVLPLCPAWETPGVSAPSSGGLGSGAGGPVL